VLLDLKLFLRIGYDSIHGYRHIALGGDKVKKKYYLRVTKEGAVGMFPIKEKDISYYKKFRAWKKPSPCGRHCWQGGKDKYCVLFKECCFDYDSFQVVVAETYYACHTALTVEIGNTDVLFFKTKKELMKHEGCIKECGWDKVTLIRKI
jgi:hypothetical protein